MTVKRGPKISKESYKNLEEILSRTIVPINTSRKNTGKGRTQVFGIINRRNLGIGPAKNNEKYPELYKALRKLGRDFGFKYKAIQLNHNYKTKPHVDKNNTGDSLIVGFGDYKGGNVKVGNKEYNIRYNPLIFNGAENEHSTTDFTGNRYSVVFFK